MHCRWVNVFGFTIRIIIGIVGVEWCEVVWHATNCIKVFVRCPQLCTLHMLEI